MITSDAFRGKRYAVLGLARSGLATVAALAASGAHVLAWDDRQEARAQVPAGVKLGDLLTADLSGFDGVVVSPGVPINRHPIADRAHEAGVPLIGDIELFALARSTLPGHKVVGITGTNGKSTTTALIHHILKTAGVPTTLGGNIGLPILAQDPLPAGGVYVLELSSYQIDLTHSLACDVAVLTNVTPDHLDRYEGFAAYERSKSRLFEMQTETGLIVLDHCQDGVLSLTEIFDDGTTPLRSEFFAHGVHEETFAQFLGPSLQGSHNFSNAALALRAVWALGFTGDEHYQALAGFPGLPHRMERVGERNGVLFVNDSKATNPTSTAPALAAYPSVHWILGGLAKTEELDACAPHFGHVKAAYTIGEAGPMFAKLLAPHMPVTQSVTVDAAVRQAAAAAQPGETVLLSPACASFDQFRDYEARGAAFRAAVEALS